MVLNCHEVGHRHSIQFTKLLIELIDWIPGIKIICSNFFLFLSLALCHCLCHYSFLLKMTIFAQFYYFDWLKGSFIWFLYFDDCYLFVSIARSGKKKKAREEQQSSNRKQLMIVISSVMDLTEKLHRNAHKERESARIIHKLCSNFYTSLRMFRFPCSACELSLQWIPSSKGSPLFFVCLCVCSLSFLSFDLLFWFSRLLPSAFAHTYYKFLFW